MGFHAIKLGSDAGEINGIESFLFYTHRRRKRGYAWDLTPSYLCGDIDMYIPLEKSNT